MGLCIVRGIGRKCVHVLGECRAGGCGLVMEWGKGVDGDVYGGHVEERDYDGMCGEVMGGLMGMVGIGRNGKGV